MIGNQRCRAAANAKAPSAAVGSVPAGTATFLASSTAVALGYQHSGALDAELDTVDDERMDDQRHAYERHGHEWAVIDGEDDGDNLEPDADDGDMIDPGMDQTTLKTPVGHFASI